MHKNDLVAPRLVRGVMMILALLAIILAEDVNAQSDTCGPIIESMSVSTNAQKCGFTEFIPSSPPKYYLMSTYAASASSSLSSWNNCPPISAFSHDIYSYSEKDVSTVDPLSCATTNVYSGTVTFTLFTLTGIFTNYNANLDPITGAWSDGGVTVGRGNSLWVWAGWASITTTTNLTSTISGLASVGITFPILENFCGQIITGKGNRSAETGLSQEFTDDMLRQKLIGNLPPYPSDDPTNWVTNNCGTAFFTMDTNHYSCTGGSLKYRFILCKEISQQKGQSFKLKWKQVTTYPGTTNPPAITKMNEVVTGNGDPKGMYSSEHDVGVPDSPSAITETEWTIRPIPNTPPGQ
jgi:hypothetical protein